jgi:hypothetical protein
MKYITTFALALAFSASVALAGEKTLTGKIACSKCTFKKTEKCGPAFEQTDKAGKVTVLLIKGKGAKSVKHGLFCKPGTKLDISITGTIKKGTIVASKVVLKKK